jgi:uncharacterized Rossmann fold enzyme
MNFRVWNPYYNEILKDFGFSREEDEKARDLLDGLLGDRSGGPEVDLSKLITSKVVYIVGNGPSVHESLKNNELPTPIMAADGATTISVKYNNRPTMIITDLDGTIEDQIKLNSEGVPAVIHAHGDNQEALEKWVPQFEGPVIGSCQCEPKGNVKNFGGFTDGDRCIFLAAHFGAAKAVLVGFDFKETKDADFKNLSKVKLRKLDWAYVLIGLVQFTEGLHVEFLGEED